MSVLFGVFALCSAFCCSSAEAQWGTLKGQILFEGEIPKQNLDPRYRKGDVTVRDAAVCTAQDIPNEELVVDPQTKGIANVAIYIQKKPAKVHPTLEKSAVKVVDFDQKGCRFLPHMMLVRTDQQVRVLSGDNVGHNTHTNPIKNDPENFVVTANDRVGTLVKPMASVEKLPTKVTCDIHSWMSAYWIILDHPYAAVTDEKGAFEIPNLPVGSHEFIIWQESAGYLNKKFTVEIKEGANDQKPMKFTAAQIFTK